MRTSVTPSPDKTIIIYVDADACPVKHETYRVAKRYDLRVTLVAARWMSIPNEPHLSLEVVDQGFDAADDWIASHAGCDDIGLLAAIAAWATA